MLYFVCVLLTVLTDCCSQSSRSSILADKVLGVEGETCPRTKKKVGWPGFKPRRVHLHQLDKRWLRVYPAFKVAQRCKTDFKRDTSGRRQGWLPPKTVRGQTAYVYMSRAVRPSSSLTKTCHRDFRLKLRGENYKETNNIIIPNLFSKINVNKSLTLPSTTSSLWLHATCGVFFLSSEVNSSNCPEECLFSGIRVQVGHCLSSSKDTSDWQGRDLPCSQVFCDSL